MRQNGIERKRHLQFKLAHATELKNELERLEAIGLTRGAAKCYMALGAMLPRSANVKDISRYTKMHRSNIYRYIDELIAKGFIKEINLIGVAKFKAQKLTHALDSYAEYQRQITRPILQRQREREQLESLE